MWNEKYSENKKEIQLKKFPTTTATLLNTLVDRNSIKG